MWRRFLPFAILLAALGAVALWIWPRAAAWHHGRRIFRLSTLHREHQGPSWPAADAEQLWTSIHWFRLNDPEGLRRRIVEGIRYEDPGHREAAAVLASELHTYQSYPELSTHYAPSEFPYPKAGTRFGELRCFRISDLVTAHPDAFAGLARDGSLRTRRSFLYLAQVGWSEGLRRAMEAVAKEDPDDDLRIDAMHALVWNPSSPSTFQTLRRLSSDPKIRVRLEAAVGLACLSDPQGTRDFIEAISFPHSTLSKHNLAEVVFQMQREFPALSECGGPVIHYFIRDWTPTAGLPCDLRAPWEAWLELRESEGFAPEPQKERDTAVEEEEERLGYR